MEEPVSITPAAFIEEAETILDRAEEERRNRTQLQTEVKQLEKSMASLDKSIADAAAAAQRRKKEEIAAGYDEKLSICQNQIKDCRTERANAKANAVAERIQQENAPLEHANTELEQQLVQLYEENNVRPMFRNHWLVVLFFPKRLQDWLIAAAVGAVFLFLIPLLLMVGMLHSPITLALTQFVYLACVFGAYLYVLHRYLMSQQHIHKQAEELKAEIRSNVSKMNAVAANIRKSQDETGYNLGGFDDRIAAIEAQMREIVAARSAALDYFEKETRRKVADEVAAANADQKNSLTSQLEEKKTILDQKSEEVDQIEAEIRDTYEARLGKDLMHRQKLEGLGHFCQENPELNLEQAVDCYRSTKK